MKYHWYKLILLLFALFFVPACGDFDEEGGESISLSTDVSAFDDIYKTSKYKANDSATRSILKDLGIYDEYSVDTAKYETDTFFHRATLKLTQGSKTVTFEANLRFGKPAGVSNSDVQSALRKKLIAWIKACRNKSGSTWKRDFKFDTMKL